MNIKTKICGLSAKEGVRAAVDNGADYLGFVFFDKSPRNVTPKKAEELNAIIPDNIKTVGVFVDPTNSELTAVFKHFKPDYIQCHGTETPDRLYDIHRLYDTTIIKAVPVRTSDDIALASKFTEVSEFILFDAKAPESPIPGGNGISFDWDLLKGRKFQTPWILSGGLNINNISEAIKTSGASIVDVSSSVESAPGVKDSALIAAFLERLNNI